VKIFLKNFSQKEAGFSKKADLSIGQVISDYVVPEKSGRILISV
jgi:hypothetical protein